MITDRLNFEDVVSLEGVESYKCGSDLESDTTVYLGIFCTNCGSGHVVFIVDSESVEATRQGMASKYGDTIVVEWHCMKCRSNGGFNVVQKKHRMVSK